VKRTSLDIASRARSIRWQHSRTFQTETLRSGGLQEISNKFLPRFLQSVDPGLTVYNLSPES